MFICPSFPYIICWRLVKLTFKGFEENNHKITNQDYQACKPINLSTDGHMCVQSLQTYENTLEPASSA